MTVKEAYKRFLIKINKNDSQSDVRINESQFVLLFNEQSIKWLSEKVDSKLSSDSIDDLEELMEIEDLVIDKVKEDYTSFVLPNNFYKYINSIAIANNGICSKKIYIYKFKPKNKNIYLQDSFTKPSFEWEESLLSLVSNRAVVYTDNFNIDKLTLEYYKYPVKIDIAGSINLDGEPSETVESDLSDKLMNEVISRCASEVSKTTENPELNQFSEQRIIKEK